MTDDRISNVTCLDDENIENVNGGLIADFSAFSSKHGEALARGESQTNTNK